MVYRSRSAPDAIKTFFKLAPPDGNTDCTLSIDGVELLYVGQEGYSFLPNEDTVKSLLKILFACVEQSRVMSPKAVAMHQMEERVRSLEARYEDDEKRIAIIRNLLWEWVYEEDSSVTDGITRLLRRHKSTSESSASYARENNELKDRLKKLERKMELVEQYHLTAREVEVLALMAQGLSNKQIAGRLFIAIDTVKSHACSIYRKFKLPINEGSRVLAARRYLKDEQLWAEVAP